MTVDPQQLARTIRTKLEQFVPDGFRDEVGVWHDGPHRVEALAALDALVGCLPSEIGLPEAEPTFEGQDLGADRFAFGEHAESGPAVSGNLLIDATIVREAFLRLLAQDSWEEPNVMAARRSFDRILARAAVTTGDGSRCLQDPYPAARVAMPGDAVLWRLRAIEAEARVATLEAALRVIASEDDGVDYDLPPLDLVLNPEFRGAFRAPAVARAVLVEEPRP